MIVLGIILAIITLVIIIVVVGGSIRDKNRKSICKNWKVGDKLALTIGDYRNILRNSNKDYAILRGWDLSNLYIECGDDMIYKVSWSVMDFNKSYAWRQNYENAKKVMGCDPQFYNGVKDENNSHCRIYDGKPIDTLSEIECEVYLKKALAEEDYDTAELIKQRMEKFR